MISSLSHQRLWRQTWNDDNADSYDDEEIECGRSNDGSGSETSGIKFVSDYFDDGKQDLGSRRTQSHQGEVGDRVVPDFDDDDFLLAGRLVYDGDFFFLRGDHLDGLHEPVWDDRNADEQVEQDQEVQNAAADALTDLEIGVGFPALRKLEHLNLPN